MHRLSILTVLSHWVGEPWGATALALGQRARGWKLASSVDLALLGELQPRGCHRQDCPQKLPLSLLPLFTRGFCVLVGLL